MTRTQTIATGVALLASLAVAERVLERIAGAQAKAPSYQVDPMWPKLPKQWILGQVSGLDVDANDAVGHGDCIHIRRAQIGVVTSGTRSPLLKKNIALARVDVTHCATGTQVEIGKLDGQQKRIPATVVRFPFYDPDKLKPRS